MAKKIVSSKVNANKYSSLIPRLVNEFGDERKVSEDDLLNKSVEKFESFIEENLFKSEELKKENWYQDIGEGENKERSREGSEEKIKLFWECIRKIKMSKQDYDFSGYVFPEFEEYEEGSVNVIEDYFYLSEGQDINFFTGGEKTLFENNVFFKNTIFLGNTIFSYYVFQKKVIFSSIFNGLVIFSLSVYLDNVNFSDAIFNKDILLDSSIFYKNININNCNINDFDNTGAVIMGKIQGKGKSKLVSNNYEITYLIPKLVEVFGEKRKVDEKKLNELSKQKIEELIENNLFKSEKNDWYVDERELENKKRNRDCSKEKIKLFWKCIREIKMKKKDYIFNGFVFPEFEDYEGFGNINFFSEKLEFDDNVRFENVIFLGNCKFSGVNFQNEVIIKNSEFIGSLRFNSGIFKNNIYFLKVIFNKDVYIQNIKETSDIVFNGGIFNNELNLENLKVDGKLSFKKSQFKKDFMLNSTSVEEGLILEYNIFYKKSEFIESDFYGNNNFESLEFKDEVLFKSNFYLDSYFKYSKFENNVDFGRSIMNDRKSKFSNITFEDVNFYGHTGFVGVNFDGKTIFNSVFNDSVDFTNSIFNQTVHFNHSKFYDLITFDNTKFIGDAIFKSALFYNGDINNVYCNKNIDFKDCIINGKFNIKNISSIINETDNDDNPINNMNDKLLSQGIDIKNTYFTNKIDFSNCIVKGLIKIKNTIFWKNGQLILKDMIAGDKLDLTSCEFGENSLDIRNLTVGILMINDIFVNNDKYVLIDEYKYYDKTNEFTRDDMESLVNNYVILKKFYLERGMYEEEDKAYYKLLNYKRQLDYLEDIGADKKTEISKHLKKCNANKFKLINTAKNCVHNIPEKKHRKAYYKYLWGEFFEKTLMGNGIHLWNLLGTALGIALFFGIIMYVILVFNQEISIGNSSFGIIDWNGWGYLINFLNTIVFNIQGFGSLVIDDIKIIFGGDEKNPTGIVGWTLGTIFMIEGFLGVLIVGLWGTFLARKVIR